MQRCPKCGKEYSDEANFCPIDAATLVPLEPAVAQGGGDDDLLGGRFRRGERIGGGRTGYVYGAVDEQGQSDCVIKVVDQAVFPTPLVLQRSKRELGKLVGLDSPGVVKVLGLGRTGDSLWIASELCNGTSLDKFIESQGPLLPNVAAALISTIGEALTAVAKLGVVHRDLAPKNVLVTDELDIGLINFGTPVPSGAGKASGVPAFVAPEQLKGKPIDQRSNIYSLGALYYFILTGQPPVSGEPPAAERASAKTNAVLQKAMEPSPSKRYMTLRQMLREVGTAAGDDAGATQPMGKAGKVARAAARESGKGKKKELNQTLVGGFAAVGGAVKATEVAAAAAAAAGGAGAAAAGTAGTATAGKPKQQPKETVMGHTGIEDEPATAPTEVPAAADPGPAAAPVSAGPAAVGGLPAQPPPSSLDAQAEAEAPTLPPEQSASTTTPASKRAVSHASQGLSPSTRATPPAAELGAAMSGARLRAGSGGGGGAGGKGKQRSRKRKKRRGGKGQFRETMWFKKGQLDAEAAKRAAQGGADKSSLPESDKADEMPMEDRYTDDGTLSHDDKDKFSLRTGRTEMMPALESGPVSGGVSETDLVREMQSGRGKYIAMIVGGVVLVIILVVSFASSGGSSDSDEGKEADAAPAAKTKATKPKKKKTVKKAPAIAPKATAVASVFVKGCKGDDAGAVWKLLSPELQKHGYTTVALKHRRNRSWRHHLGYRGKASKLDGKVYFSLLMKKKSKWAACSAADEFDVDHIEHKDGVVTLRNTAHTGIETVVFEQVDGKWVVSKVTRAKK